MSRTVIDVEVDNFAILRNNRYELRVRVGRKNHRILYFFHGRNIIVLSNGLTKEKVVPPWEIIKAIERKKKFENDPKRHSSRGQ